ncbi:hypothetical protein [Enterococcus sp. CSURQ0835]|uniref:hypothetical protein n=1 Tax=Enterococcus sp. CSURQ0835 TaxID=2681394 RepID=UPI00135950A9|nr:hypothetical protein [Enterococcus sp. CSURQ0835]
MRYTDEVSFVAASQGAHHDTQSGEWVDGVATIHKLTANVTDSGIDVIREDLGEIARRSKIVRLQPLTTLPDTFEYIEYNGERYEFSRFLNAQNRKAFVMNAVIK